jgi:magnesium transporter
MQKLIKKRSRKAGLSPGTLIHIGEKKAETLKITVMDYDEAHFQEKEINTVEECFAFKNAPGVTWINIDGLHRVEILEKLGECYGFHPLVLEDILNTDQRPKMEDYGDYLYIVLRMLSYNDKSSQIETEQVSLILGPNFVFSFQESQGDVFDPVRERIRSGKGRIRTMGSDYLAYGLLDLIVDNYFMIMEKLGETIEFLEEKLVTQPVPETLQTIHQLKRELIFLRKAVWPLREVIGGLERGELALIKETSTV